MNKTIALMGLLLVLCGLCLPAGAQEQKEAPKETGLAIVKLSVCHVREKPDYTSQMITEGLMGMPVRVLDHKDWYQIQLPDDYVGWVHRTSIKKVSAQEMARWNKAPKVVVTAHYGVVYAQPSTASQTLSDVVAGDRFRYLARTARFWKVAFPDNRVGYLLHEVADLESHWRAHVKHDAQSIIATAKTLLGVPYLWAGLSSKGMDCSGFVRNVLFMHDIIIPRDAGPQSRVGRRIDIADDFGNLLPGDLVFFGRAATDSTRERVSHVAIYMGKKRFIHSLGYVQIGSFDPRDKLYDRYNTGRLLFATRFLPYLDKAPQIITIPNCPYYKETFK